MRMKRVRPGAPSLETAAGDAPSPQSPITSPGAETFLGEAFDVVSELLRAVHVSHASFTESFHDGAFTSVAEETRHGACATTSEKIQVIGFHVVVRGACWFVADDGTTHALAEGDALVFPESVAYQATSQAPPHALDDAHASEQVHLISGWLRCDRRALDALFDSFPTILITGDRDGDDGRFLDAVVRTAIRERRRPRAGSDSLVEKLAELFLTEALRRHVASSSYRASGAIAGSRDARIASALRKIHHEPSASWTVGRLARVAGMSRSAFAQRFGEIVGVAPMQYLTHLRMQIASTLLGEGSRTLAEVARSVGYASETSFHRAFKKTTSHSPGTWRRLRETSIDALVV